MLNTLRVPLVGAWLTNCSQEIINTLKGIAARASIRALVYIRLNHICLRQDQDRDYAQLYWHGPVKTTG